MTFRKGLEKFYIDLDLVSVLTTVRRMKVMTDLMFTENQKYLEKYSIHHTIENPNFDDLDYFKTIPKLRDNNSKNNAFIHSSLTNANIRRLVKDPITDVDKMLINQIAGEIFNPYSDINKFDVMKHTKSSTFFIKTRGRNEEQTEFPFTSIQQRPSEEILKKRDPLVYKLAENQFEESKSSYEESIDR